MLLTEISGCYQKRRQQLMANHPESVFIFPAWPQQIRNSDVYFPYRQDGNFYYLSGFEEPESYLVLAPSKSSPDNHRMILFIQPRDLEKEIWDGERYGIDRAQKIFGADEVYPNHEMEKKLLEILYGVGKIYYRLGLHPELDRRLISVFEESRRQQGRTGRSFCQIADPNGPVGEMRMFKSEEELDLLRKACVISSKAHSAAMKQARPGMNEFEIEALVDFVIRKEGCQRLGYPSIVASGKNSTCLHYRSNNEVLNNGELLLIDAGGELGYYTSDITRTFPVGRKFSPIQAKVYDLVLQSQKAGISIAKPGTTLIQIHQHVCRVLTEGLLSLGLLEGNLEEILKAGSFRRYYPHHTSHWLGMDVHDIGLYTKKHDPRPLEPGMVFTIEPGLYIQPSDFQAPDEYRGIGIRIEDDVLITPTGCEVLTKDAPKEREELEALKQG
jgi:Xaa-Pro aminopeptidase